MLIFGGDDVPKLEPKTAYRRLTFWALDPIIKNLRHMHKEHLEWFEVPKPKSDKGKNMVDYSIDNKNNVILSVVQPNLLG